MKKKIQKKNEKSLGKIEEKRKNEYSTKPNNIQFFFHLLVFFLKSHTTFQVHELLLHHILSLKLYFNRYLLYEIHFY